jgi:phosphatidate cytidylyltransferase
MAEADPAHPSSAGRNGGGELTLRVASALVLAPLAVAVAYIGGWSFVAFWGAAAFGVLWEWDSLVTPADRRAAMIAGGASVLLAVVLAGSVPQAADEMQSTRLLAAIVCLLIGSLGTAALAAKRQRAWVASGVLYAGVVGVAPVILRIDAGYGFLAIVFLFAIVWATDIAAYFVGRAIGGPKLVPDISPKKTWSGAIGGTLAALIAAIVVAKAGALADLFAIAMLAIMLSILAQAGDIFESALKRRFDTKDSSHLIPGHGGLMDRLDGFMAAAALAALIGLARGGIEGTASGLLLW